MNKTPGTQILIQEYTPDYRIVIDGVNYRLATDQGS